MKIESPITYTDVLKWRIHWLYCSLDKLYDRLNTQYDKQPLSEFVELFTDISCNKYQQILWEVSTMMGDDTCGSEVHKQVKELDAYKRFIETYGLVKARLRQMYDNEAEAAKDMLEQKLNRARF